MSSETRRKVRLSECATFQEGYVNPSQRDQSYFGEDIKWLRATDLNDGFVFETSRRLSKKGFESAGKSATLFAPGTLAISKSGTIGRIGILKDYMCGNRAVINIKPNESCDSRFIFYTLLLNRPTIETLAEGSVQKNLYVSTLGSLEIEVPSLSEQKKISGVLGALDDRIALLRETNATLEAIAQALFKSWFVDFDPVHARQRANGEAAARSPLPPGEGLGVREESGTYKVIRQLSEQDLPHPGPLPAGEGANLSEPLAALFPDSFEESPLGLVPRGWRMGLLGDVAETARKQIQPGAMTADTLYVGLEHIPRQSLGLDAWGTAEELESAKSCFEKGDILFGKLRPYFHKIVIAPFAGVCSTDILVCRAQLPEYYGFVAMHLFSTELVAYADRLSNGAKMPRVNWKDLADYPVVIPPSGLALAYAEVVQPMFDQITDNVLQAKTLATLRDTLLPRLISGQLRLPEGEALVVERSA